ncbi:MAG: nucleotidyltransferase family protein [Planctomycetota bacterium]|jgi:molybdenum cofactor cytidylyltransferase
MINAVVLAAGQSKRMGKPKPLLKFNQLTFLGHIISVLKLSEVDEITVVLGAAAEEIKQTVDLSEVTVVINKDYLKGQLSSLISALEQIPEQTEAIILCLVDHPFHTEELVNEIIHIFRETQSSVIIPVYNEERGHPTLFSKALFNELINAPLDQGARYVVYSNEDKILELKTTEKGTRIGIDTPQQYKSYFKREP